MKVGWGGEKNNTNSVREQRGNDAGPGWKPTVIVGGGAAVTDHPASKLDQNSWQMQASNGGPTLEGERRRKRRRRRPHFFVSTAKKDFISTLAVASGFPALPAVSPCSYNIKARRKQLSSRFHPAEVNHCSDRCHWMHVQLRGAIISLAKVCFRKSPFNNLLEKPNPTPFTFLFLGLCLDLT